MTGEVRRLINDLTLDIIRVYGIEIPIHDIDSVVSRMGGRIEEKNDIGNMFDGCVIKDNEGFVIYVSGCQNKERRTFTIAHELGHLFLHMGFKINSELWNSQEDNKFYRRGNSIGEYQANEFAASLLMPKDKYKDIMDEYSNGNMVETAKIAEYFGVSISAASNRGKFLGYLQW